MPDSEEETERTAGSRPRPKQGSFLLGLAWKEKIKRPKKKPLVRIHFYWKRVGITLLVLAVTGWLAGGAALYYYFKEHRDFEEVSFFKMLVLPLRLDQHRKEMGEYFVEKGMREIKEGEFRGGFHHLRIGLARSPANAEARIMLAGIFNSPGFGERRLAIEALVEGLKYSGEDPKMLEAQYLGFLFYLLELEEQDERSIELADELLEKIQKPEIRSFLVLQAARCESNIGRLVASYQRLQESRLGQSPQGLVLVARIFEQAGQAEMARLVLERGMETYPQNQIIPEELYMLLIGEERWEDLLSQTNFRLIIRTSDIRTATARLYALDGLGLEDQIIPAAVNVFNEQIRNENAAIWVLQFAVETERPDVARAVFERLQALELVDETSVAMVALSLARSGKPRESLDFLKKWEAEETLAFEPKHVSGTKALAFRMLGDDASALTHLQRFLSEKELSAPVYILLADAFAVSGYKDYAYEILLRGVDAHPTSSDLLQKLVLDFEKDQTSSGSFVDHVGMLVEGRVPGREILEEVRAELASDRFLFSPGQEALVERIDDLIGQSNRLAGSSAVATSAAGSIEILEQEPKRELLKIR